MSFEKQPTPSKEGLTEAFKAFSEGTDWGEVTFADLKKDIWSSDKLTKEEKIALIIQIVEPDLLLARRNNYLEEAA